MTNRQKRLLEMVRPSLSDVYRSVIGAPYALGTTIHMRVARPFTVGQFVADITPITLEVVNLPDGPLFRLSEPGFWYQKGHTEPKWRRLHA